MGAAFKVAEMGSDWTENGYANVIKEKTHRPAEPIKYSISPGSLLKVHNMGVNSPQG